MHYENTKAYYNLGLGLAQPMQYANILHYENFDRIRNYSHSPARVTPPLTVTPGPLSLPQMRTSDSSIVEKSSVIQSLSVCSPEQ